MNLTDEQKAMADQLVSDRMANTGETRAQAAKHVAAVLHVLARRDRSKDVQHPDGSMSFEWPKD